MELAQKVITYPIKIFGFGLRTWVHFNSYLIKKSKRRIENLNTCWGRTACYLEDRKFIEANKYDDSVILNNIRFASIKYALSQKEYFYKELEWDNNSQCRQLGLSDTYVEKIPVYLFPWHLPAINFISGLSKDVRILDICTGIGSILIHLTSLGFKNLSGVDDSNFQTNIIRASHYLLNRRYNLNVSLYDFFCGYQGNYKVLEEASYNVIMLFGASTYNLYQVILPYLKRNGYFIIENNIAGVPKGLENIYREIEVHEKFGRHNGYVSIIQKIVD